MLPKSIGQAPGLAFGTYYGTNLSRPRENDTLGYHLPKLDCFVFQLSLSLAHSEIR